MDGTEIYHNFQSGNTDSLQSAADLVKQLSDGYQDEATAIRDLQDRMNAAWTGDSGDAAMAGANPLAQAFIDSAPPLDITTKSMSEQSEVFQSSKAKVVEVPPAPEKPSGWSVGLKAAIPIVGPGMAVSDIKSYQDGVAATNAANENNVRVMQQYSAVTDGTRSSIPMDYKTLPIDGASVGLKPATPAIIEPLNHEEYIDRTTTSSTTPTSASSTGSVDPVRSGPNLAGPSNVTSSGQPASIDARPTPPRPTLPDSTSTTGRGNTNPSQFVPGPTGYASNSTTERPGTSGYRSTTNVPGTSVPGRNTAAGRLYEPERSGRGGSVSERGTGGPGESVGRGAQSAGREGVGRGGAAGEGARSLGAGKGTGAGNLGSAAAAEEAAAGRNAARGAGGAPMGAGGRRGEGAKDDEHRRPDYLIEPDPDSVFGTDVRATPPVIGE